MFEALVLRSVPGVLNLAVLLILGDLLSLTHYGQFSMAIAVTGFIALVAFGPLLFSVISQHASIIKEGHGDDYESSYVSLTVLLAAGVLVAGLLIAWIGLAPAEWGIAVAAFGIYSVFQELLRAQLRPWAYGIASMSQSLIYLGLVLWLAPAHRDPLWVLNLFSVSYACAAFVSLYLLRFPRFKRPNFSLLSQSLRIGGGYIGSTIGEQSIYVGMRYIITLFGTSQQLGIFSFAVDLATRTVGFLINAASFIFIPLAFHRDANGSSESFTGTLRNGATISLALSAAAFVAILLVRELGWIPSLNSTLFNPIIFAIISLAIVLNRLKKLLADPYAMRARRPFALVIGYAVAAPPALILGAIAYNANSQHFGAGAYLAGYFLAILVTLAWLRHTSLRSSEPE
ncbi:hypothetical protein [Sphingopyxis chilensis]